MSTAKLVKCVWCGKERPIVVSTPTRDFCSHECAAAFLATFGMNRNTEPAASEAPAPPAVDEAELPPAAD